MTLDDFKRGVYATLVGFLITCAVLLGCAIIAAILYGAGSVIIPGLPLLGMVAVVAMLIFLLLFYAIGRDFLDRY